MSKVSAVQSTGGQGEVSTQPSRTTDAAPAGSARQPAGTSTLSQAVSRMNEQLKASSIHVEVSDAPSGQVWVNVVDNSTNKVLYQLPPQAVREMEQGNTKSAGLIVDKMF